jgi:hypothetical protein
VALRKEIAMADAEKTLTVKVNARLAVDYRIAYERAFGRHGAKRQALSDFIAGFVEDRLAEEIEFAQSEVRQESQ